MCYIALPHHIGITDKAWSDGSCGVYWQNTVDSQDDVLSARAVRTGAVRNSSVEPCGGKALPNCRGTTSFLLGRKEEKAGVSPEMRGGQEGLRGETWLHQ